VISHPGVQRDIYINTFTENIPGLGPLIEKVMDGISGAIIFSLHCRNDDSYASVYLVFVLTALEVKSRTPCRASIVLIDFDSLYSNRL
jgi:hypothetical protein